MKTPQSSLNRAFTLLETVIAIGVLAVLLTGFVIVFAPAAAGIKKAISVQEADRLTSTLEQELVTLRPNEQSANIATGFDKAYKMIEDSMKSKTPPEVVFVYQYRGNLKAAVRTDKTYAAYKTSGGVPGVDFTVIPMARRRVSLTGAADPNFKDDLDALEGRVYAVKMNELVFSGGQLIASVKDIIEDPTPGEAITGTNPPISGKYPEAYIPFAAEFYSVPASNYEYLKTGGKFDPLKLKNPLFTRNLAVRR